MKKKAIEKIPYLKLQKTNKKRSVKYIGVTAVKIISHEKHLFLEVYENKKTKMDVPLMRIVLTRKDFGTYDTKQSVWSREKILTDYYYCGKLLWTINERWGKQKEENILQSDADMERIKKFCKTEILDQDKWWGYIYKHQDNIAIAERRRAENRAYQRRKKALNDRIAHTRKLPEQKILKWADTEVFHHRHYLYYKKHGCKAQIACSKCGGVTDARWKESISYESQFQPWTEEPRAGQMGTCPMCGAHGEYKCQGKVKRGYKETTHVFLGQRYKQTGMVLRYIEVDKIWNLELVAGEKGAKMYNAREILSGVEIARAYFEPGEETQIDYQKYNGYDGRNFWDDCNTYGCGNINIREAPIMEETYEELKGTEFQYSALEEYVRAADRVNPIKYFECYEKTPQLELLVKLGLIEIAKQLVEYHCGITVNKNAKRPDEFLGIRKERVKQLIDKKGDTNLLRTMQIERHMQQIWTDEQLYHLAETRIERESVKVITKYMSLQQLLNRIEHYAGCEYGLECSGATFQITQTATTYVDYLNMRLALGYDLKNTIYQKPKNLEEAHAKMTMETNKEQIDKRLREVKEHYPNIKSSYMRLRKQYLYEDDAYIIRPARSAEEIVAEGRILHHCVGGDGYLRKHNDGTSYILMLRRKADQKTPYITVEINGDRPRILQWYGQNDRKPDEKIMQRWLDDYVARLKGGNTKTTQTAEIA